jgi:signal transduction histidine kinase
MVTREGSPPAGAERRLNRLTSKPGIDYPISQLIDAERMSAIGRMACSISHDMRHSLTAIYANAAILERHDICANVRADLLLEIQEAVLAMTERIDSLVGADGKTRLSMRAFPWFSTKISLTTACRLSPVHGEK